MPSQCVSLDQKRVQVDGKGHSRNEQLPALHPQWKKDVQFVTYQPPPLNLQDGGAMGEWRERTRFIQDDLQWLLTQNHQQFWCQMVFDETLHRCVDSYLKSAPRSHDVKLTYPADMMELQRSVHQQMFMVCLRMSTHKESKENFITPSVFGEILYENFLFDIPKIMDLCALYGASNGPLLTKMISNIFQHQPGYMDDLQASVITITEVFSTWLTQCGVKQGPSSPQKLSQGSMPSLLQMDVSDFHDIIHYILDTAVTLTSFLNIFPAAAQVFMREGLAIRLSNTYEGLVLELTKALKEREWEDLGYRDVIKQKMHRAFKLLLQLFHQITFNACLQPLLEARSTEEAGQYIETYLDVMASVLGERRFLADLESFFPFAENKDMVLQSAYQVDDTRIMFIEEAISQAMSVHGRRKKVKGQADAAAAQACVAEAPVDGVNDGQAESALSDESYAIGGAAGGGAGLPAVTGVELESLISSVKDLLPDLGEGFIQKCLDEYNYDTEKVVNALLEDNLLPSLHDLDRTQPRDPAEIEPVESILDQRTNIYDNDEFDVFHRKDVDTSRIHQGKKDKTPQSLTDLDDKSFMQNLRPMYERHGGEFLEEYDEDGEYDDEYDDTYDTNAVGAKDADSADEITSKRHVTTRGQQVADTEEDSGSDEQRPPRDEFVQNPEVIRARQEARRLAYNKRHGHSGGGQGRNRDVKGKPKGQGQDTQVVRNRANKEKNKSTRVHHNRKVLADKKRKF